MAKTIEETPEAVVEEPKKPTSPNIFRESIKMRREKYGSAAGRRGERTSEAEQSTTESEVAVSDEGPEDVKVPDSKGAEVDAGERGDGESNVVGSEGEDGRDHDEESSQDVGPTISEGVEGKKTEGELGGTWEDFPFDPDVIDDVNIALGHEIGNLSLERGKVRRKAVATRNPEEEAEYGRQVKQIEERTKRFRGLQRRGDANSVEKKYEVLGEIQEEAVSRLPEEMQRALKLLDKARNPELRSRAKKQLDSMLKKDSGENRNIYHRLMGARRARNGLKSELDLAREKAPHIFERVDEGGRDIPESERVEGKKVLEKPGEVAGDEAEVGGGGEQPSEEGQKEEAGQQVEAGEERVEGPATTKLGAEIKQEQVETEGPEAEVGGAGAERELTPEEKEERIKRLDTVSDIAGKFAEGEIGVQELNSQLAEVLGEEEKKLAGRIDKIIEKNHGKQGISNVEELKDTIDSGDYGEILKSILEHPLLKDNKQLIDMLNEQLGINIEININTDEGKKEEEKKKANTLKWKLLFLVIEVMRYSAEDLGRAFSEQVVSGG